MKTEYSYNPTTVYIDPNAIDMEEYGAPMSEENPMKVVVKEVGETPKGLGALDGWMHVNPTSLQIDIESVAWQLNNDDARPNMEKFRFLPSIFCLMIIIHFVYWKYYIYVFC